jgi:exopolyphosphatase / guanosine-5'-triphosphate,3'-diphosphate pyrophosphatase
VTRLHRWRAARSRAPTPSSGAGATIFGMRVGIVDVGSNTVRLLVADVLDEQTVETVATDKEYLGLGAEIVASGTLSPASVEATASVCRRFAKQARSLDVARAEVIVTAPGRQGAATGPLVAALRSRTGLPVRILTADEEGRLAYEGAVVRAGVLLDTVAVVDVGGGSTEIAVGAPAAGPAWVDSVDLGSLRLTRLALLRDPPTARELAAARGLVRAALAPLRPPPARLALAVGGSARAVAKLVGGALGAEEIEDAIETLARRSSAKVVRRHRIDPRRAGTLLAGALILAEVSRMVERPLVLARGGLREGAAVALASDEAAAA